MKAPHYQESGNLPASEHEVTLLLQRLLDLMAARTPMVFRPSPNQPWDAVEQPTHGRTIVQFEYAGLQYKLIKAISTNGRQMTLSQREQEIVDLVATGHSDKTIARELAISPHTVNTHIRRIFGKLGVNNRAEMVAYALQTGLVREPEHHN